MVQPSVVCVVDPMLASLTKDPAVALDPSVKATAYDPIVNGMCAGGHAVNAYGRCWVQNGFTVAPVATAGV